MQKERMNPEKAHRHRHTTCWLRQYGNYIAAAGIFIAVVAVVVVPGISTTIKGERQAETTTDAGTGTQMLTIDAGSSLNVYQSQQKPQPPYKSMIYSRDWDAEDAEMLLKIAMAEAEGESTEGKAMVMLVVLNRTWSKDFLNTIEEVIFQTDPDRQFSVTKEGGRWWTTTPDEDCVAALELVESGWDESWGAMYFESYGKELSWHSRNLDFLFQLGNHKFYK